jgi:hypothetical protein
MGALIRSERRRAALLLLGGLGLLLSGCVFSHLRGEDELAFSHELHVQGEQLECAMCHEDLAAADEPGMPPEDACMLCHEELDAEKPEDRRVASLFADGVFKAAHASELGGEVVFSHLRHVEAQVACNACHAGIESNERVDGDLAVDMASCVACHERLDQPAACATCHSAIDQGWKPPSHDGAWQRAHGARARAGSKLPAESCSLCHKEDTCAACHRVEAPANHTHGFRLKGHGLLASMDRTACSVCHEPSSCEACHAETLPTSHGGMWGGTKSLHCLTCHTPLEQNGCVVCHKATPSHALAPPKPDWHDPGMNCQGCHGRGLPLSHVDNGENCNLCHF